jgi:colanic acid biosynthesis protein WcaH
MRDLSSAIRELESWAPAPEQGLGEELTLLVSRLTPMICVDLLVQDPQGRTLLTWRHDRFYGPGWHIPGGMVRYKERLADRIQEVARQELAAEVAFEPAPLAILECMNPESRDRGHLISLLFRCRLLTPLDDALRFVPEDPRPDQWQWHERCPANLLAQQAAYRTYIGANQPVSTTRLLGA